MGSTYLQLTNRLLRRLNEVELTTDNFNTVRGLQATIKDAILDSIREITNRIPTLAQAAYEHTQDLETGVSEYAWPEGFIKADWDSFQIQKDDTLNVGSLTLNVIDRNEWYVNLKDRDDDSETDGWDVPNFVFEAHGTGFGVSPRPNADYSIKFRYWKNPTDLAAHGDQCHIPNRFDPVIIAGGLYHMFLFRDNAERTAIAKAEFEKGLKQIRNTLNENPPRMQDTVIYRSKMNNAGYISIGSE